MPVYTPITLREMQDHLESQGFVQVYVPGCYEVVYSRVVAPRICVRVFTTILLGTVWSRSVGGDAIRVCLVGRAPDGRIYGIGRATRVHRTQGWKGNVQKRIEEMTQLAHAYVSAHQYRKGA